VKLLKDDTMSDDLSANSIVNRSGGVDFHAQTVNIYGDVTGRDKIDASSSGAQLRSDTRERYLEQIIRYHRDLDFVGIPELKDRQALQLENVFIHLQAEIEVSVEREPYLLRREEIAGRLDEYASEDLRRPRETVKRKLSVNSALRDYLRMVILGDPGAGKTTLLKYVTLAFATQQSDRLGLAEDRLPIFIRLYDYVAKRAKRQTDYSLVDYLCTQAHENLALSLDVDFFQDTLERGECCVCLDGLDELGGAGLRREVIAAVNALVNKYPNNRYLITSRLVSYEEAPLDKREFVHHTVLPFSDDDIRAFVTKWYDAREKDPTAARERSKHLIDTIMREERIKTLATNPLMLTIIALVHRIEAELPHERVKLYDKCVTAMIQTWEEVKGLRVEDRQRVYYKQRRRLLEQLAYWMHSQPGERGRAREIKEGDLELQIRRFLLENPKLSLDDEIAHQEAHDFVQLVKGRTGLLIKRGEGVYSFAHLTFQEYLAATDIVYRLVDNIDAMWAEIQPHLHDTHWREVILLLLGSLNKFERHPTELVRRIFESTDNYEPVLHRNLFLAARGLADRVEVDVKLHHTIIDQLMLLAAAPEEWIRRDAFAVLSWLQGNRYVIERLYIIAQNPLVNTEIQYNAAKALSKLGQIDDASRLLLTFALDYQGDEEIQVNAVETLGQLGRTNEDVLRGLRSIAQDAQGCRYEAALALAQLGQTDEALRSLFALAQDYEEHAGIRYAAAEALGQFGLIDEAVQILSTFVQDSQVDTEVRYGSAEALRRLGRSDDAAQLMLKLAEDQQTEMRLRFLFAQSLGESGYSDEAARVMLALIQDPKVDVLTREHALYALSRLGKIDEVVLNSLLILAQDSKVEARNRAVALEAISKLGPTKDAAKLLITLLQDPETAIWVYLLAPKTLGKFSLVDESTQLLLTLIKEPQPEGILLYIAKALVEFGKMEEAIPILITLVQNSKTFIWPYFEAVQMLGQFGHGNESASKCLLAIIYDSQDSPIDDAKRHYAYDSLKSLLGVEA
jgi:thioredoxin-like negative regulator of GroEL